MIEIAIQDLGLLLVILGLCVGSLITALMIKIWS